MLKESKFTDQEIYDEVLSFMFAVIFICILKMICYRNHRPPFSWNYYWFWLKFAGPRYYHNWYFVLYSSNIKSPRRSGIVHKIITNWKYFLFLLLILTLLKFFLISGLSRIKNLQKSKIWLGINEIFCLKKQPESWNLYFSEKISAHPFFFYCFFFFFFGRIIDFFSLWISTYFENHFSCLSITIHSKKGLILQEKVYQEIMSVIPHTDVPTIQDLAKLRYTENVIKETLRLYPPVPMIGRTLLESIVLPSKILFENSLKNVNDLSFHQKYFLKMVGSIR